MFNKINILVCRAYNWLYILNIKNKQSLEKEREMYNARRKKRKY